MRPIAIFRFSPTEGPAYLADWLDRNALSWRLIALDENAAVPHDPTGYAGIAMMGGPMSANDAFAWSEPLARLIRDAVDAGVPVIGHCLGGQLLARALGAPVVRASRPEIGWLDVAVCDPPAQRGWFGGRSAFTTFQWHYDAFGLPAGATRVLTNGFNAEQAYVVDDRHLGLQCHIEMTQALTCTWLATGARELPERSGGSTQSAEDIARDLDSRIAGLHAIADDVYSRWAQGLAR